MIVVMNYCYPVRPQGVEHAPLWKICGQPSPSNSCLDTHRRFPVRAGVSAESDTPPAQKHTVVIPGVLSLPRAWDLSAGCSVAYAGSRFHAFWRAVRAPPSPAPGLNPVKRCHNLTTTVSKLEAT